MLQAKEDTTELQERSKGLKADIVAAEENVKTAERTRDKTIMLIGNLVPDSVPVSNDEVCIIVTVWLCMHAIAALEITMC